PGFSKKWGKIALGKICKIQTGKKDVNQGNHNGIYPFFTCAKQHTYSDTYSFDCDAILIAGNGDVGNCQFYSGKFEVYQRTYLLNDFKIFIHYIFPYLKHFFQNTISIQKQMGAMPYIKLETIQNFNINIPHSNLEQNAIAKILITADEEIEVLEKQKEKYEDQKKYLLNNLITGKIRVPKND
ncbi:restriction endonuclease subunit S, partial [Patescibacteria group bacterium]|nr:restriction endonuclease subunit S [Patescibacteria group bacterium]